MSAGSASGYMADFNIPRGISELALRLEKNGFEAYAVGGCVRDLIMGRTPADWDLATNADIESIKRIFPEAEILSKKFSAARVIVSDVCESRVKKENTVAAKQAAAHKAPPDEAQAAAASASRLPVYEKTVRELPADIVTYRREAGYENGRPVGVSFINDIREDLPRRDFTINALALRLRSTEKSELLDMFGGLCDIRLKTVRTVGSADRRFKEDPLRILRGLRIAAELDFFIDKEAYAAMKTNRRLLKIAGAEKSKNELIKLLSAEHAGKGFKLMLEIKALHIVLGGEAKRFTLTEILKLKKFCRNIDSMEKDGSDRIAALLSCLKKKRAEQAVRRLGLESDDKQYDIIRSGHKFKGGRVN